MRRNIPFPAWFGKKLGIILFFGVIMGPIQCMAQKNAGHLLGIGPIHQGEAQTSERDHPLFPPKIPTPDQPTAIPKQELEAFINKKREILAIPGLTVAVNNGQETWTYATGYARLAEQTPIEPGDKFRIGSMTKTFTSMVVLQLAQECVLALDDPVPRWLPDLAPNWSTITVRQLLNHTSGIGDFTHSPNWILPFTFFPTETISPTALIELGESQPRTGPPGRHWSYSSTNTIVLGMIIEAAGGHTWQHEVQTRFLEHPALNLRDTVVPDANQNSLPGAHTNGYVNYSKLGLSDLFKDQLIIRDRASPSFTWSSGDMFGAVADLSRWMRALGRGILLNEEYYQQQFDWRPIETIFGRPAPPGMAMGLGILRYGSFEGQELHSIGHRGQIYGFDASMQYLPDQDVAITVFANRTLLNGQNVDATILFELILKFFPEP